ncbi:MAG: hypothetical protein H0X29_08330 [Parachlamydiaceae bacterium]|nr:hypothetical protein [Parachlamydiaceae bacterium]
MNQMSITLLCSPIFILCILFFASSCVTAHETIKIYVDCDKVQTMCKELCTIIKSDDYKPDLLIGLSRGGLQPASYLAGEKQLNLRNVATIALTSYDDGAKQGYIKIVMPFHVEDYKKYKSILIVDDLVDSGKTMSFIKSFLEKELPESTIKVAVLYYKPTSSKIQPDYYVQETDEWIVFPWEN